MNSFSQEELAAIYKVADKMVWADGKFMPEEQATVQEALKKAGVDSIIDQIHLDPLKLSDTACYGILSLLDPEQKKFVSSMLGAISSSDGDIDDRELILWREICDECNLPVMNNRQAINIFKSY